MNGEITVSSRPGQGSTFTFNIFLNQAESQESPQKENTLSVIAEHVLLVEDNPINKLVACKMLAGYCKHIDIAVNGEEAIKMGRNKRYDLIFMDIFLPDMSGYVVTQELRQIGENTQTPIIALTANVLAEDKQKAAMAGMNAFLKKPIDKREVERVLNEIIKL